MRNDFSVARSLGSVIRSSAFCSVCFNVIVRGSSLGGGAELFFFFSVFFPMSLKRTCFMRGRSRFRLIVSSRVVDRRYSSCIQQESYTPSVMLSWYIFSIVTLLESCPTISGHFSRSFSFHGWFFYEDPFN